MEKIVEQGLLYDFYGELLTEHQRHIYEDVVFNDMSPSEIAEEQGISRQGVHDLIKRCNKILTGYEEKLKLVQKFNQTKQMVEEIKELAGAYKQNGDISLIDKIETLSEEIGRL
ncbi:MAG: YlxM family DNA-binding protein [Lachnospiraceae bacterium]|nr:YlxM family DNA-binding protein [Lachnospiraceae bacterium]MBQ6857689.1 YlxM family DNA-binding protein [Lachnospiraceae bacterium]